jgi:hypothetical protein
MTFYKSFLINAPSIASRRSGKAPRAAPEPAANRMICTNSVGCASFWLLAIRICCRESKTVQYGFQFHFPRSRESRRKAEVGFWTRVPSAPRRDCDLCRRWSGIWLRR